MSGDPADGRFDPAAIFATLNRHGVTYALIGGLGARLHGANLVTYDADILPRNDPGNIAALSAALVELDARLRVPDLDADLDVPWDAANFEFATTLTFTTRHGNLDVSLRPDGLEAGWPAVAAGTVTVHLDDLDVPVAALDDIIASKQAAGRPKDLATLPLLREVREAQRARDDDADRARRSRHTKGRSHRPDHGPDR